MSKKEIINELQELGVKFNAKDSIKVLTELLQTTKRNAENASCEAKPEAEVDASCETKKPTIHCKDVTECLKAECNNLGLEYKVTSKGRVIAVLKNGEKSFSVKLSPYMKATTHCRVRTTKALIEFLNLTEADYTIHEKWPAPYELKMDLAVLAKKVAETVTEVK